LKRIVSILLVFIIILNGVLFGVFYYAAKIKLKNDFWSSVNLKEDGVSVTKVSSDEINSNLNITFLENDEIKINGEFFDIIKTEIIDGKTIYYCLSDDNEEHLEKALTNFLSFSLNNFSSKPSVTLLKVINIVGIPSTFQENLLVPHFKVNSFITKYSLYEVVLKIPTPPPEPIFS
jgi:hypothetical protein